MNSEGYVPAQESWSLRYCNSDIALSISRKPRTLLSLTVYLGQGRRLLKHLSVTPMNSCYFQKRSLGFTGPIIQAPKHKEMFRFLHTSCLHPSRPKEFLAPSNYGVGSKQVLTEGLRVGLIHTTTLFLIIVFQIQ